MNYLVCSLKGERTTLGKWRYFLLVMKEKIMVLCVFMMYFVRYDYLL